MKHITSLSSIALAQKTAPPLDALTRAVYKGIMRHINLPTILLLLSFMVSACEQNNMDKENNVTPLLHQAIDLSGDGDYDGAIALLTQVIEIDPNNKQAYFERGLALFELDRNADAIVEFDHALRINPQYTGARDWRAKVFIAQGEYKKAADEQLISLRNNPDGPHGTGVSPGEWDVCARSFIKAGDDKTARKLLEEYFDKHVQKVGVYVVHETAPMRTLSTLLIKAGDSKKALDLAKQAYLSKHQKPADILAYALALQAAGEIKRAQKILQEAVKINDQMPGMKELEQQLSQ